MSSSTVPLAAFSRASAALETLSGGLIRAVISEAPKLLVMKIIAREKSTLRPSPRVSAALSMMPSSRFHQRV